MICGKSLPMLIKAGIQELRMSDSESKRFINNIDIIGSMTTTIAISEELKTKLKDLGRAGDTYEDVIRKMYEVTRKSILQAYLYDGSDCVSVDEAIARARKECHK